jgi:hypothetical protein
MPREITLVRQELDVQSQYDELLIYYRSLQTDYARLITAHRRLQEALREAHQTLLDVL